MPSRRRRLPPSKFKRPFLTRYYATRAAAEDAWTTQGTAKTETGAVRASVPRIFDGQHRKAVIFSRDTGAVLHTLLWDGRNLTLHYGRLKGFA